MVWVRPGVLLVLAILLPTSELIRLDLPTLERPKKRDLGRTRRRELQRGGGGGHKARQDLHAIQYRRSWTC